MRNSCKFVVCDVVFPIVRDVVFPIVCDVVFPIVCDVVFPIVCDDVFPIVCRLQFCSSLWKPFETRFTMASSNCLPLFLFLVLVLVFFFFEEVSFLTGNSMPSKSENSGKAGSSMSLILQVSSYCVKRPENKNGSILTPNNRPYHY